MQEIQKIAGQVKVLINQGHFPSLSDRALWVFNLMLTYISVSSNIREVCKTESCENEFCIY